MEQDLKEKPELGRLQRRLLIAGMYGGYALLLLGKLVVGTLATPPLMVATELAGALLSLVCLLLLFRTKTLWRLANSPDKLLDERQVRVRDHAYRLAYMGMAAIALYAMIYVAIAVDKQLWLPTSYEQASLLVWGVLLLALTLPAAIIGWTEADI